MTAALLLNDLLVWSFQIGLLVSVAAVLRLLLPLKLPGAKLAFCQLVLMSCFLLPLVRAWKQEAIGGGDTVSYSTTIVSLAPGQAASRFSPIPMVSIALLLVAAGIVLRLGLLGSGFWRLRRYRLQSQPLTPACTWSVEADLRVSGQIGGPVTFGFRRPVVLLPTRFPELHEDMRDAILCHEILHVRRNDWLFMVAEEFVRALFWFHPAIWWLLREIQLVREQVVDREVVEITRSRDRYIDALLVIAGAQASADLAPAPLFLGKGHLKQRIISVMKEVQMSRPKSFFALSAAVAILAGSGWLITGALPLQAAPQLVRDASGVSVETNGAQLIHRQAVDYPRDAIAGGVQGTVVVQVKLDAEGSVSDASVISGPEELRKAALQSILNWHFTRDAALGTRQVSISFTAPTADQQAATTVRAAAQPLAIGYQNIPRVQPNRVVSSVRIDGISDEAKQQLLAQLPMRAGDTITSEQLGRALDAVHAFDRHLTLLVEPVSATEAVLSISPASPGGRPIVAAGVAPPPPPPPPSTSASAGLVPGAVTVGGAVQNSKLVSQAKPEYPPLAKAARVQGAVAFDATIGTDGTVQDLKLISGPPLLVPGAMDAVRQWIYRPTLLNGNPVAVRTTIEVNFTLAE